MLRKLPHYTTDLRQVYYVEDVDPFIDKKELARIEALSVIKEPFSWSFLRSIDWFGTLLSLMGLVMIVVGGLFAFNPVLIMCGAALLGFPAYTAADLLQESKASQSDWGESDTLIETGFTVGLPGMEGETEVYRTRSGDDWYIKCDGKIKQIVA